MESVPEWEKWELEEFFDPSMVAEYANEIFEYMRKIETGILPDPNYMANQKELTWKMRTILVDWLIEVQWTDQEHHAYPIDIEIQAIDRHGLLRDIYSTLAHEKIDILSTNTHSDRKHHTAMIHATLEITDINQLSRILSRIGQIPNILEVRRKR